MLNIITACSRPENLSIIKGSILSSLHVMPIKWTIVYDSSVYIHTLSDSWILEANIKGGIAGSLQKNVGIDLANEDDFLYFLDDDNLLHPHIAEAIIGLTKYEEVPACVFNQLMENDIVRTVTPEKMVVGEIDQAQIMTTKAALGELRYDDRYDHDGKLIEAFFIRSDYKFLFISEVLSYYNRLKWKE